MSWPVALNSDLGEVELQGVIGGQRDHEAAGQVLGQWVPVVAEEEAVVAERGHGDANLGQVIQVLQDRGLGRGQGGRAGQVASGLESILGSGGYRPQSCCGESQLGLICGGSVTAGSTLGSQCGGWGVEQSRRAVEEGQLLMGPKGSEGRGPTGREAGGADLAQKQPV